MRVPINLFGRFVFFSTLFFFHPWPCFIHFINSRPLFIHLFASFRKNNGQIVLICLFIFDLGKLENVGRSLLSSDKHKRPYLEC